MPNVAKGVITRGLGGNATNMILGRFNLGPLTVVVEVPPEPPAPSAGAPGVIIPKKKKQKVIITVYYKDKKWRKEYWITMARTRVIILVTKIINTITTNISVSVGKIKRLINNIRIRIR